MGEKKPDNPCLHDALTQSFADTDITLRDLFAAAALAGLAAQTPTAIAAAELARQSFVCADAMLAERQK